MIVMTEKRERLLHARVATVVGIVALLQLAGACAPGTGGSAATGGSWLFIAYMSADEPGSPLNWSADINEMESGLLSQNITVIAMVDPPGMNDTAVYKIARDPSDSDSIVSQKLPYPPLGAGGEANMGNASTLADFIGFAIDGYYSGGKVGIIPWGHGNGWMGVCEDRGDYLEPKELAQGLGNATGLLGRPVDLVIFDACSMSSLEVLSLLPGLAEYSVSSEIQVPEYGFPYDSILASVSADPSMGALAVAKIFADDYVRFGALVAGITSQAAVMGLSSLQAAAGEFEDFCDEGALFVPLARSVFNEVRNSTFGIGGGPSVDLMRYLIGLAEHPDTPKRLARASLDLLEGLRNSTALNKVFIAPIDAGFLTPDSFQGFSVFFPNNTAQISGYVNASDVAAAWAGFLELLLTGAHYTAPDPGIDMHLSDDRYGDGLADSISFVWGETPVIDEWSCDALVRGGLETAGQLNFSDSAGGSGALDELPPGHYDVCVYGIAADGSYRYYGIFENVSIMRRYTYEAHLPEYVAEGVIEMVNLETGENSSLAVSGDSATVSFVVPTPFGEGDRILLTLVSDGATVARGLVVLSGDATDVYLVELAQPTSMANILLFLLAACLIVFAFVRLNGVDRGSLSKLSKRMRRRP